MCALVKHARIKKVSHEELGDPALIMFYSSWKGSHLLLQLIRAHASTPRKPN